MSDKDGWINLYDSETGRYQGRYHPVEQKLLVKKQGGHTLYDLGRLQTMNQPTFGGAQVDANQTRATHLQMQENLL